VSASHLTSCPQASFGEAQRFLTAQGVNPPALADQAGKAGSAAEGVFNQAKPSLTSSLTSLSSRDPGTLAEYALGAIAFYYLVSGSTQLQCCRSLQQEIPCATCIVAECELKMRRFLCMRPFMCMLSVLTACSAVYMDATQTAHAYVLSPYTVKTDVQMQNSCDLCCMFDLGVVTGCLC